MHILYDHQIFTWQRYGGISRYYYELMSRICRMPSMNVSLFQGLHINEYDVPSLRDACKRYFGIKMPVSTHMIRAYKAINCMLFNAVLHSGNKPDLYHQTYYSNVAPGYTGRRVVTVLDMIHERYPAHFPPHDKTTRIKRDAVARAVGVICISQSTKRDLIDLFQVPERKIKVIYLGNSLTRDASDASPVDAPYILYVGLREHYKNFTALSRAYARSPRLSREFKLVCFGGGYFTAAEQNESASLGIAANVLHRSGDDGLLASLYAHASVLVYPSLYEGFGIPPLEAMHYGCPVLASNASSIPEVVGDAGLYFDPAEPDDLLQKLEGLLGNDSLRDQLRSRGRRQEQKFNWDACAQETSGYYRTLTA
jgi:glycosyltransferase involved in cell wall biosynthesis